MRYPHSFSLSVLMIILFIIYLIQLFVYQKITIPKSIFDIKPFQFLSIFRSTSNQTPNPSQSQDKDPHTIQIDIVDNQYMIENENGLSHIDSLRIPVGQKIRWLNNEAEYHTVTHLQERLFNSGNLKQLDKFEYTFDTPGRYWVYCRNHPQTIIHIDVLNTIPPPSHCPSGTTYIPSKPIHFQPRN